MRFCIFFAVSFLSVCMSSSSFCCCCCYRDVVWMCECYCYLHDLWLKFSVTMQKKIETSIQFNFFFILAQSHFKTCQKSFQCHDRTGFFFHPLETQIYYYCLSVIIRLKEYFHDDKIAHKYTMWCLTTDCITPLPSSTSFNKMTFDNRINILSNDYCDRSKLVWNECGKWRLAFVWPVPNVKSVVSKLVSAARHTKKKTNEKCGKLLTSRRIYAWIYCVFGLIFFFLSFIRFRLKGFY